jgi:lipopolysaccharide export system permease protein
MTFPRTLVLYVGRRFLVAALAALLALTLLVALFDFIELLRRGASRPEAGFATIGAIAALRLPFLAMQIMPFAILLGGMLAFWRLTRSSELVVARAAGVSAWGFLLGPVVAAALIGGFAVAALSPLSSVMFARAERLENVTLRGGAGISALAGGKLWLRQADQGIEPGGVLILAGRPQSGGGGFALEDVSLWRLSGGDRLLARVEAARAALSPGRWVLEDAVVFGPDRQPRPPVTLTFPSELTPASIQDSFASPDTLSVWALPGFIQLLEGAGFSAIRHRLQFQSLLATPLLAIGMALLAAVFSTRTTRMGGAGRMIAAGVAAGFALFVLDRVTAEFGETGALPVWLAAWTPSLAGLLLALGLLLYLEDG